MKQLRKILAKVAPLVVVVFMVVGFSAYHARRACDEIVRSEIAPPPRYSTQFVLYPSHYMDGADELGFKPGWVVTYAPRSKQYGTALFVSFFGKMLARGTPGIVTQQHRQNETTLENLQKDFARLDAAVRVGSGFSEVVSALGHPHATLTNDDGSLSVFYHYEPRSFVPVDWLTNGFSLVVSNDIVVQKDYSYSSYR